MTDDVFTPAHGLAEAVRRRKVTSVEPVDLYLAQIALHNPRLNAVVTFDEEGKTNGPEIWPDSVFARTNNPLSLEHTPGGSSSGPGAALAAGPTPLDTLGSIQNPSHYCGVFGMRPTEHRVPR